MEGLQIKKLVGPDFIGPQTMVVRGPISSGPTGLLPSCISILSILFIFLIGCSVPTRPIASSCLAVQDLSGNNLCLENLIASSPKTIVHFWSPWCTVCRPELVTLSKMYPMITEKNIQLIGISVNNSIEATQRIVDGYHISFPTVLDTHKILSKKFKLTGIPATVTLDQNSNIIPMMDPQDRVKKSVLEGPRGWDSKPGLAALFGDKL